MSSAFSSLSGKSTTRPKIPATGDVAAGKATSEQLARVVKHGLKYDSFFRLSQFRTWQMCDLFKEGNQWLEPDDDLSSRLGINGVTPYVRPAQVAPGEWIPMPVQNEIVGPLQNEQARLVGVGSRPFVRPKSSDANVEKGAKLATDVLRDTLDQLQWPEIEIEWIDDIPTFGTGIIKTSWEIDRSDTVNVPVLGAMSCQACGATLASDTIDSVEDPSTLFEGSFEAEEVETDGDTQISYKFNACPTCGGGIGQHTPLPNPDMAGLPEEFGADLFGRPLSESIPKGKVSIRVVSPYNYFPQSLGVGVNQNTCTEWNEEHVETLDWIRSHYPENGYRVKAESPVELAKWHPIIGASGQFVGSTATDIDIFDNHANVKEFHKAPWVVYDEEAKTQTLNKGRSIIIANDIVLLDADYMIESSNNPGVLIPRVQYTSVAWEARKGQLWGIGAVELMIPLQRAINSLLSQVQDARHRFGSPKILLTNGTNLQYSGMADTGYTGDVYTVDSPMDGSKPEFFGNTQMEGPHFQELQGYIEAIARIVGTMDVEIGNAPRNISSASGVMYIGEKASERRKKRITRIREAKRKIYRHVLQLIHEMYREEHLYHVRGRNGKWEVKAFQGSDLLGQDDVQLEDEPYFDLKMFKRESVKDGLNIGTITADSALSKRKINAELGISQEINEEANNQVIEAEDEWLSFINEGVEPYVDRRKNDHMIHYKVNLISLDTQEGKDLAKQADWGAVEMALWGWEEKLDALEQSEAYLKTNPVGAPPEDPPAPIPSVGSPESAAINESQERQYNQLRLTMIEDWNQRKSMAEEVAQYPKALEQRILKIWEPTLSSLEVDEETYVAMSVMARWRAHIEAHYRLASQQSVLAGQGVPIPAPPGGVETQTGNIPGNPVMAMPGPGTGPGATTAAGDGGS